MPQDTEKPTIYVGLEIAGTPSPLHRWEYCLVTWPLTQGYQPSVEQLDLRDLQIMQNPSIIARYFAFRDKTYDQTQLVLYWFENSIFTTNGTSQQKYVEISLIAYPTSAQDVGRIENELLPFAISIVNYWQPIRTWTTIATVLSSNGLTLAEITTTLLAALVIFYTSETIRQRRTNASAYQKLSEQSKQIIDTIVETEKTAKPTLQAIDYAYQDKTGLIIEKEELMRKLTELERTGTVETSIASVQDEPTRIWKIEISRRSPERKRLSRWKQIIAHAFGFGNIS
jgi:hypothetical protein